jgi:hypothetical protein
VIPLNFCRSTQASKLACAFHRAKFSQALPACRASGALFAVLCVWLGSRTARSTGSPPGRSLRRASKRGSSWSMRTCTPTSTAPPSRCCLPRAQPRLAVGRNALFCVLLGQADVEVCSSEARWLQPSWVHCSDFTRSAVGHAAYVRRSAREQAPRACRAEAVI